jgi:hypothetical protein
MLVAVAATLPLGAAVDAGSHLWQINEVFSSADGTVQFIEMKECCGAHGELFILNKWVESEVTGARYTFASNLTGDTAHRHLLLATQAFAELPGAPAPDFIIDPHFFDLVADELTYWFYPAATFTFTAGQLPLDGIHSLRRDGSIIVNSPTNYVGQSGSVLAPCDPADFDVDGTVGFADLGALLSAWGPCAGCAADIDEDDDVDFSDLLAMLAAWGPCS